MSKEKPKGKLWASAGGGIYIGNPCVPSESILILEYKSITPAHWRWVADTYNAALTPAIIFGAEMSEHPNRLAYLVALAEEDLERAKAWREKAADEMKRCTANVRLAELRLEEARRALSSPQLSEGER